MCKVALLESGLTNKVLKMLMHCSARPAAPHPTAVHSDQCPSTDMLQQVDLEAAVTDCEAMMAGPRTGTCKSLHGMLWEETNVLRSRRNGFVLFKAAFTFCWVHDGVVKQCGHAPSCSCKKHTLEITTRSHNDDDVVREMEDAAAEG